MSRRLGKPLTDAQRRARHKARFGTSKLPPRGSGLRNNPQKPTTYVCFMYKRKSVCFTKAELERAQKRVKKMEARAEAKIAPYRVGKWVGYKKR